ncbi:two-component system response regulator [Niastella yeongjuensis]|uniref:Two-component system response regulator n=1 Tax=Niastella yeongjuensis TaxID=354355 RepID=A0A1V9E108_9BACT|nr:response regulator transcription factor [Niastella yeongjuensis]OQP39741.1 two-component system response regulator [Niastella yeongjuensis]SEO03712.1 DNA-binding response regulator, OmpR family, contains REC and winged-helix (wHTH) domain [Niastella yeongjuensis]
MLTKKVKVLLAEDDMSLGYVIKDNLQDAGYEVVLCPDGQTAIEKFDKTQYDICLLDVMMPNKDGFTVARRIRQQSDMVPILFLTAKSMEEDKIKGFLTGADDYITKPFSMQELLLRMDVFIRRSRKLHADSVQEYSIGQMKFSYTDLKLHTAAETFTLTQKEADLLKFLCEHANHILKRDEVLLNVWGKDDYFLGRSMDVFMTKLRKYFKADPNIILETIHGVGFRFNAEVGLQ